MGFMKMAPRQLFEEYLEARKKPCMIHFAGYQKPWDTVDCDLSEYFWKYAELSPYYPLLLKRVSRVLEDEKRSYTGERAQWPPRPEEPDEGIRKIAAKLLPYGSRRREALKAVVLPLVRKLK